MPPLLVSMLGLLSAAVFPLASAAETPSVADALADAGAVAPGDVSAAAGAAGAASPLVATSADDIADAETGVVTISGALAAEVPGDSSFSETAAGVS